MNNSRDYDYYSRIFRKEGCQYPLSYVDLDLFDQNVRDIASRAKAKNKPIRIHTKSLRIPALIKRILDYDPQIFQGLMCYSPQEAVFMSEYLHEGFKAVNIILGYPIIHRKDIEIVAEHVKSGKGEIIFMFDSEDQIQRIDKIGASYQVKLKVCMDVDMSSEFPGLHFGVHRSPINTPEFAIQLGNTLHKYRNIEFVGIMGYEAQIAGLPENNPGSFFMNRLVRVLKHLSIKEITARRKAVVDVLESNDLFCQIVNGGGTGSIESTGSDPVVTEITVGSGFYSPTLFDHYKNFKYLPAAGYALEIVRIPKPGVYTCLGGGYVASGGSGKAKEPQVHLPEGAKLDPVEGAGEVQTPVFYGGQVKLELGDPVILRHSKAGELFEHFNSVYLLQGYRILDTAKTYRGFGHSFL